MKKIFQFPFCRWMAAVIAIVLCSILVHEIIHTYPHVHKLSGVYKIHYVNYRGRTDVDAGFEKYLRDHGIRYTITYHDLRFDVANADEAIKHIEADKDADLIVTWGTSTTLAIVGRQESPVSDVISEIPTVFTLVTSPDRAGILAGKYITRRNVTGSSHIAPLYNQFRTMMAYHPAQKIGMIFTPTELNSILTYQEMRAFGKNHGVEVIGIGFTTDADGKPDAQNAASALKRMKAEGVEWLYLPPDSFLGSKAKDFVIPLAHSLGIRTFASTEQMMKAGAAFGLVSPYLAVGAHTAAQAVKILRDKVRPEDIPVDTAPRFIHQVNVDALSELKIDLPRDLLSGVELISNLNIESPQ